MTPDRTMWYGIYIHLADGSEARRPRAGRPRWHAEGRPIGTVSAEASGTIKDPEQGVALPRVLCVFRGCMWLPLDAVTRVGYNAGHGKEQPRVSIESIRKRWEAATPGPWNVVNTVASDGWGMPGYPRVESGVSTVVGPCSAATCGPISEREDAEAIAHAPTDIAALLAVAEAVKRMDKEGNFYVPGYLATALDALEAQP